MNCDEEGKKNNSRGMRGERRCGGKKEREGKTAAQWGHADGVRIKYSDVMSQPNKPQQKKSQRNETACVCVSG